MITSAFRRWWQTPARGLRVPRDDGAKALTPPQDVTHNRSEFSSGSQSPAAANPARHCLARKQGYAANRTSGATPARRACVGTAAASAPDRSVLPPRCGADVSAFLSLGAALAGQAGEPSRGPGNSPAGMCRDIRKQKRCWAPAVGSRRKRTAGRGLRAQRCLLSEAVGNPRLSSSATPAGGNLTPPLPGYIRAVLSHPNTCPKEGTDGGSGGAFHGTARAHPPRCHPRDP